MKALSAFLLLFSVGSFAQAQSVGKLKQIDVKEKKAVVELTGEEIAAGDKLVATFSDNTQCFLAISSIDKKMATVSLAGCGQTDHLKVGQELEKSLIAAGNAVVEEKVAVQDLDQSSEGRKLESWYTLFGLGWASVKYEDDIQDTVDELEDEPTVDHLSIGMDFLGFYWPLNHHKTMMGVVVNGAAERWEGPGGSLSVYQYLLAFSTQHFFTGHIGQGWFVRGDVGFSWYILDLNTTSTVLEDSSDKEFGGYALGGGYAFSLGGDETSLLVSAMYTRRKSEDETVGTTSLMVGFLF